VAITSRWSTSPRATPGPCGHTGQIIILSHEENIGAGLVADSLTGAGVRVLDEVRGEGGDRTGQGLPLGAGGLVAPVEEIAQQVGVGGEQARVEAFGDLADGRAGDGERGADGGCGLFGQREATFGLVPVPCSTPGAGTVVKLAF
jgi:hypothetical protein